MCKEISDSVTMYKPNDNKVCRLRVLIIDRKHYDPAHAKSFHVVDGIENRALSTIDNRQPSFCPDCTSQILDIDLSEQENPDDLWKSKNRTKVEQQTQIVKPRRARCKKATYTLMGNGSFSGTRKSTPVGGRFCSCMG